MFTSSAATNLSQQSHHHNYYHLNHLNPPQVGQTQFHHQPHQNNQSLIAGQNIVGQQLFSLAAHGQSHQQTNQQTQTTQQQASLPQFLDTSQQLVAQFNHQTTSLTNGHFGDGLNTTDTSQFMHQPTPQLQDGSSFNPAAVFFHHQNSNHASHQHHGASQTIRNGHHSQHQLSGHHLQHHQQHQQISCANTIASSATGVDDLSLTSNGQAIIESVGPGLLRLANGANLVSGDQTTLVVSTIKELRQQQRSNPSTTGGTLNGRSGTGGSNRGGGNQTANNKSDKSPVTENDANARGDHRGDSIAAAKLATSQHSVIHGNTNENLANDRNSSNNHSTSNDNRKDSNNISKNKSNGNSKREKSDSQSRNSESPRRTFACPTCGKGFTEKFNMKRHMQIHSQSRPKYICNECSKSFAWKDNFIRHKKAAHVTNLQHYQAQ